MADVRDENWFGSTKTLDMHVSWFAAQAGKGRREPAPADHGAPVGLRFEP
jgi:hypothetical protein